jgi:type II secretion system protein H
VTALRQRAGRTSAFTLVELVVVLTVIAVLSAMILPEMRGSLEETLLRATARRLIGACNVASSRAISSGRPLRLVLGAGAHRFKVVTDAGESHGTEVPRAGVEERDVDVPGAE